MPKGKNNLPDDSKQRSETTLAKVLSLAPLVSVIVQAIELLLRLLKKI